MASRSESDFEFVIERTNIHMKKRFVFPPSLPETGCEIRLGQAIP